MRMDNGKIFLVKELVRVIEYFMYISMDIYFNYFFYLLHIYNIDRYDKFYIGPYLESSIDISGIYI
jgi:hypothetical protein